MGMNIYEKMGDTVIIYMPSEVDDYAAGKITEATEEIFERQEIKHVVFDFRITTFMDSSGIGIITRRFRQVQARGGSVGVINVNGRIDRILLMSGIYRIASKLDGGLKDA